MQTKLVDRLPVGEQWRYELKLGGYRAIAIKVARDVKLISRNEKDLSGDYPELVEAFEDLRIPPRETIQARCPPASAKGRGAIDRHFPPVRFRRRKDV
jgi:ATP-dependent DNA ligase